MEKNNIGVLNKTRTYLVGAMQYENGRGWRDKVESVLIPRGIICFNPYNKPLIEDFDESEGVREELATWMETEQYDRVATRMKSIRASDLSLVDRADFIIAHINPKIASWGSAEELTTCIRMKRPCFVSIEGGKKKTPYWLLGMMPHKYFYNNIDEVLEKIKGIDDGTVKIDSDRWRLLKMNYR
jgi:hypothetical protein